MPIRIEHQPSAFAVGVAGYAAGQGRARERQGKYALDLFQDQQRFQNQQNLMNQRNQWLDERDAKKDWETMPSMANIPDTVDPQTRRELADLAAQRRDARRKFGYDDQAAREADRVAGDKYDDIIRRHVPPSEAEAWNRGLTYVDEKTGQASDQPGEGLVPYRGGQRAIDNRAEQAAAEKLQQQQAAAAEKAQANRIKRFELEKSMREAVDPMGEPLYDEETIAEKLDELFPIQAPSSAGGAAAVPEFDVVPGVGIRPVNPAGSLPVSPLRPDDGRLDPRVAPRSGAPGGGSVREDGMIDLTTRSVTTPAKDWAEEAWPDQINANGQPVPSSKVDPSTLSWEEQQKLRRAYESGSDRTRGWIERTFGPMTPLDEMDLESPESKAIRERENRLQESYYGNEQPTPGAAKQHVAAQRGPQGTGEGIRSDAAKMLGGIEGAGGVAGREAARLRGELGPGQTRVTKYNVEPTAAERESSMDERYAKAMAERERKTAAGQGIYAPATAAQAASAEASQLGAAGMRRMVNEQERAAEQQRRKANVQASKIRITTDAEYDRLRPGTWFTGPDGKVRRKV